MLRFLSNLLAYAHALCALAGQVLRWSIGRLRRCSVAFGAWLLHHVLSPLLCFSCIYIGVVLTFPLPATLWNTFTQPTMVAFPLAELPDPPRLVRALLTALPLTIAVFRRHFAEWRTSSEPLGARMLYACYAGVVWPKAWWRGNALVSRLRKQY